MDEYVDYEEWFLKVYENGFCNLAIVIKVRRRGRPWLYKSFC